MGCRPTGGAGLYELDELLGTKLRALYQRKKGRDLFDLGLALKREGVTPARVVEAFTRYLAEGGTTLSRALFEQNMTAKKADSVFTADMTPLLASGQTWSFDEAYELVWRELIGRLPGAAVLVGRQHHHATPRRKDEPHDSRVGLWAAPRREHEPDVDRRARRHARRL